MIQIARRSPKLEPNEGFADLKFKFKIFNMGVGLILSIAGQLLCSQQIPTLRLWKATMQRQANASELVRCDVEQETTLGSQRPNHTDVF